MFINNSGIYVKINHGVPKSYEKKFEVEIFRLIVEIL